MLSAIQRIAERKIEEAMNRGALPDLSHWKNKPLPKDDMEHVPTDLRMGYRMLKNAGYVPEEVGLRKEIQKTEDLLCQCVDEKEKYKQLTKLNYLKFKLETKSGKSLTLDERSPYYEKVVNGIKVRTNR